MGPIALNAQFLVLRVGEQRAGRFADVRDQIISSLPAAGQAETTRLLARARRRADISIDPRYGRWDPVTGEIVAPTGPDGLDPDASTGAGAAGFSPRCP